MPAARNAKGTRTGTGGAVYERHRPELTLLYQLVEGHYPEFARLMVLQGTPLPG